MALLAALLVAGGVWTGLQGAEWLGYVLGAHLATAGLMTWASGRGLDVALDLPKSAHSRRRRRIELTVFQTSRLPAFGVAVELEIPGTLRVSSGPLAHVPGKGRVTRGLEAMFTSRGRYRTARVAVSIRPMALFGLRIVLEKPIDVIIYPPVELLGEVSVGPGSIHSVAGEESIDRAGQDSEFHGLREYMPGDSPRHVHWASLARTGKLVVKEYTRASQTDVTLAVDMTAGAHPWPTAQEEELVSVASSIALHAHLRSIRTQVLLAAPVVAAIRYGTGDLHQTRVQSALAHVRAGPGRSLVDVLREHHRLLSPGTTLVVVAGRHAFDLPLRRYLLGLEPVGVRPMLVLVPFEPADGGPDAPTSTRRVVDRAGPATVRLPVSVLGRPVVLEGVLERIG